MIDKHFEWDGDVQVRPEDVGGNTDVVRASELVRELHDLTEKNDWPCAILVLAEAGDTGILPDGQVAEHGAAFTVWRLPDELRCEAILPGFGWLGMLFATIFRIWAIVASQEESAKLPLLSKLHQAITGATK